MTTAPALKPSIDLSAPSPEWTTAPLLASLLQQATTNATVEEIPPEAMAFGEGLQGGIAGAQAVVTIVSKGFSSKPGVGNSVHCGREVRVELRKGAQNVGEVHAVAGSCIAIANGTAVNVPQIGNESGGGARACLLADEEERCEEYVVSYSTASVGEFQLSVAVDGREVAGSPFHAFFYPELTQPFFNSSTLFPNTDDVQYGDKLLFTLMPRNFKWQHTNSCDVDVTGLLVQGEQHLTGTEQGVRAAVTCQKQARGAYYLLAVDEKVPDGAWQMVVMMQGRHVDNSPLLLTIRPLVSASMSELSGEGVSEAMAGQAASVSLRLVMHTGQQAADCRESATLVLVEQKYTEVEEVEGSLTPVGNASMIPGDRKSVV